jgi:hypothetical protein
MKTNYNYIMPSLRRALALGFIAVPTHVLHFLTLSPSEPSYALVGSHSSIDPPFASRFMCSVHEEHSLKCVCAHIALYITH